MTLKPFYSLKQNLAIFCNLLQKNGMRKVRSVQVARELMIIRICTRSLNTEKTHGPFVLRTSISCVSRERSIELIFCCLCCRVACCTVLLGQGRPCWQGRSPASWMPTSLRWVIPPSPPPPTHVHKYVPVLSSLEVRPASSGSC
jgi:hypothetical protein